MTLLHTNDIHASFRPEPATWQEDKALIGGFETLDALLEQIRATNTPTLLLDGGDVMTGNPISQVPIDGIRGWGLFDLMNQLGYDAWTLGNHDFDNGQEDLARILPKLKFPTVSANLEWAEGSLISKNVVPSVILSAGGIKIGVIGVMTPELPRVVARTNLDGVRVTDPVEAVRRQVELLDPKTDLLVVLSHMGDGPDKELAAAVPALDVVIGGHSHQRVYPPVKVGHTLVVQAGSNLRYLGRLDLEVAHDEVVDYKAELIPLWVRPDQQARPAVHEAVAQAQALVDEDYKRILGELLTPWSREYYAESNVGDWLADQIRQSAGAEVAFINSGGIRKDLNAGPISKGDLMSVLPFDNKLCTFKLTGAQLEQVVQANAQAAISHSHGVLQVSGLRYTWRRVGDTAVIDDLTVNGAKVVPDRLYVAATNEFLLFSQPEKYFAGIEPTEPTRLSRSLLEAMVEAVDHARRIDAPLDGRIVERTEGK